MAAYKHVHIPETVASQSSNNYHYMRGALVAFNQFYSDISLKKKKKKVAMTYWNSSILSQGSLIWNLKNLLYKELISRNLYDRGYT